MRNPFAPDWVTESRSRSLPNFDRSPLFRLSLLYAVFAMPAIVVLVGVVRVQTGDPWAPETEPPRITVRSVPAPAGRILSAEGVVLAEDLPVYELWVEYPWIPLEPDENWLRATVRRRLRLGDRSAAMTEAEVEQTLRTERTDLWRRLSEATGEPLPVWTERRVRITERVVGIWETVNRRREEKYRRQHTPTVRVGWRGVWDRLRHELTTAPPRPLDPLVIAEQVESHRIADVPRDLALSILAEPEQWPGVEIRTRRQRRYPQHELAAHVIGYRVGSAEDTEEITAFDREAHFQPQGRTGLERAYDRHLRGIAGTEEITVGSDGETIGSRVLRSSRPGRDVQLTLRADLQRAAERLLRQTLDGFDDDQPRGGVAVVMEVDTGRILSAASLPEFDLNLPVDGGRTEWETVRTDARRPLFPRLTGMAIPPGSVFKPVTAIAAIETGIAPSNRVYPCQGFLDHPRANRCSLYRHYGVGHGELSLREAVAQSCNIVFFTLARELGPMEFVGWADRFGFGQRTGIDLPHEASGALPGPRGEIGNGTDAVAWGEPDTLALGIGQSRLTATPLQITRMTAAIANGGRLVVPHLVERDHPPEPRPIPGLSPGTLVRLRVALAETVAHPRGTGHRTVRHDKIAIAGKTGTAEVGGNRPAHAWFTGYLPAERPRFAITVVIEHGGSGGQTAGPIAHDLASELLRLGLLADEPDGSE